MLKVWYKTSVGFMFRMYLLTQIHVHVDFFSFSSSFAFIYEWPPQLQFFIKTGFWLMQSPGRYNVLFFLSLSSFFPYPTMYILIINKPNSFSLNVKCTLVGLVSKWLYLIINTLYSNLFMFRNGFDHLCYCILYVILDMICMKTILT